MRFTPILASVLILGAAPALATTNAGTMPEMQDLPANGADPAAPADPALAGNVVDPMATTDMAVPVTEPVTTEPEDSGGGGWPWGLVGLIGLIGLLGRNRS